MGKATRPKGRVALPEERTDNLLERDSPDAGRSRSRQDVRSSAVVPGEAPSRNPEQTVVSRLNTLPRGPPPRASFWTTQIRRAHQRWKLPGVFLPSARRLHVPPYCSTSTATN